MSNTMKSKEVVERFMDSHEPGTFEKDENGVYMYYTKNQSSGLNLESFFIDLVNEVRELNLTPVPEVTAPPKPIYAGDTVIVDKEYNNGGYEAKVIAIGDHFATIECDGQQWDLMINRLTKIN